jgi:hypothetical protein
LSSAKRSRRQDRYSAATLTVGMGVDKFMPKGGTRSGSPFQARVVFLSSQSFSKRAQISFSRTSKKFRPPPWRGDNRAIQPEDRAHVDQGHHPRDRRCSARIQSRAAALLAVAEVESNGQIYAEINDKPEPVIRRPLFRPSSDT